MARIFNRNFFGPTGVTEEYGGRGLGQALLFESLNAMRTQGHAYTIISGVGLADFYAKACGAELNCRFGSGYF